MMSDAQRKTLEQVKQKHSSARYPPPLPEVVQQQSQAALPEVVRQQPQAEEATSVEEDDRSDNLERRPKLIMQEELLGGIEEQQQLQPDESKRHVDELPFVDGFCRADAANKVTGLAKKNTRSFHHAEDVDPDDEDFDKDFFGKPPIGRRRKATTSKKDKITTTTARQYTRSSNKV
jgi:hypothetical protein